MNVADLLPADTADLMEAFGVSRSAVYRRMRRLVAAGDVETGVMEGGPKGRRVWWLPEDPPDPKPRPSAAELVVDVLSVAGVADSVEIADSARLPAATVKRTLQRLACRGRVEALPCEAGQAKQWRLKEER